MPGDLLFVVLILVLGCAAFFFGVIYILCQGVAWIWNGVAGVFRSPPGSSDASGRRVRRARRGGPLTCPRPECGRVERRPARYCSQCGTRLTPPPIDEQA